LEIKMASFGAQIEELQVEIKELRKYSRECEIVAEDIADEMLETKAKLVQAEKMLAKYGHRINYKDLQ